MRSTEDRAAAINRYSDAGDRGLLAGERAAWGCGGTGNPLWVGSGTLWASAMPGRSSDAARVN